MPKKSISELIDKSRIFEGKLSKLGTTLVPYDEIIKLGDAIYAIKGTLLSQLECYSNVFLILSKHIEEKIKCDTSIKLDHNYDLNTLFDIKEQQTIRSEITQFFNSIPRLYSVRFNLPNTLYHEPKSVHIGKEIKLSFESRKEGANPFSLKRLTETIDSKMSAPSSDKYFMSIDIKHTGYLGSRNFEKPFSIFKQIIYLGICLDLFSINNNIIPI